MALCGELVHLGPLHRRGAAGQRTCRRDHWVLYGLLPIWRGQQQLTLGPLHWPTARKRCSGPITLPWQPWQICLPKSHLERAAADSTEEVVLYAESMSALGHSTEQVDDANNVAAVVFSDLRLSIPFGGGSSS